MSKNKSRYLRLVEDNSVTKVKFKYKTLYLTFRLYEHTKIICIITLDKKDFCLYSGTLKDANSLKLMIERFYTRVSLNN